MSAPTPSILPAAGPALPDEALVRRILGGDVAALELLMRRHNQRLYRVARSVLRDGAEAEDVVQEAYVRAYRTLARFEGRSSVATWLSRITFHEALRRRRLRIHARQTESTYAERAHAEADARARELGDAMAQTELREVLVAAIDALPPLSRAVVTLRFVEGLSTRETAASLRMTESNVKVTLHRARAALFETVQRRAIPELRQTFAFAGDRCDRIVAGTLERLGMAYDRRTGEPE